MKKLALIVVLASLAHCSIAQRKTDKKSGYGKNVVAFNPMHLMSDNHVGVGLSYEHMANNYLGIKVPVMIGINSQYVNVGVEAKLYPTRNTGAVRYAIGPTIMYGMGQTKFQDYIYNPQTGNYILQITTRDRTHFGFLLNNSLNVTIMQSFYIGIDGGLGINYYDSDAQNTNNNMSVAAQLHFGLGYRF